VSKADTRPAADDLDDDVIDSFAEETDGDAAPWEGRRGPAGRERGDRRPAPGHRFDKRGPASFEENGDVWIWGLHAAGAALANPARRIREALLTRNAALRLGLDPEAPPPFVKLMEPREIDHRLPEGAVHQGACVRAAPLEALDISDVVALPDRPLVILDQLTDPQNVGAVFRSAAAFGFGGVVMQTRRAPGLGGALAKAAAGGIETTPEVRAVNLARAIDALTDAGWTVVGLDGGATEALAESFAAPGPLAIVLGAEGSGLRPAVANACSRLARIPMPGDMESLNVSNAAAIAFYEASRRR
jgi:23S rRNA (guanosine2251-2'-O)-methyltransferase